MSVLPWGLPFGDVPEIEAVELRLELVLRLSALCDVAADHGEQLARRQVQPR